MGRDPNEGNGRKGRGKGSDVAPASFWTFHPTSAEKEALNVFCAEQSDPLGSLETYLALGISFTLTRAKTNDSWCVIARDASEAWGSGQAVSVFHSSLERAVLGMLYVLQVKHPEWPLQPITARQQQLDW